MFQSRGLIPTCCTKKTCTDLFSHHGIGKGAADTVAASTEVLDLLVSLSRASAASVHAEKAFEPYPCIQDPKDDARFLFTPDRKDFQKINQVLNQFPTMQALSEATSKRQVSGLISSEAMPLLSWIINSNTSHIEKLPEARHIKSMGTIHQYHLLSAPPKRERIFSAAKRMCVNYKR